MPSHLYAHMQRVQELAQCIIQSESEARGEIAKKDEKGKILSDQSF
jgi:hypothetical protein